MITVKIELDCYDYLINKSWGGAAILADELTEVGYLREFAECMDLYFCDLECTLTEVNDVVCFEPEVIAEISDNEEFKAVFNKLMEQRHA